MEPDFSRRLSPAVYRGDAFELAQNHLLGAYLCSEIDGELTAGMITELEVYIGSCDKACHAWPNKKTPRTATMFKPGGCAYVFFVYGMYNQFNVVAGPEGTANAVLIRSLEPVSGLETMMRRRKCENPANLTTGPRRWLLPAANMTVSTLAETPSGSVPAKAVILLLPVRGSELIMPKSIRTSPGVFTLKTTALSAKSKFCGRRTKKRRRGMQRINVRFCNKKHLP